MLLNLLLNFYLPLISFKIHPIIICSITIKLALFLFLLRISSKNSFSFHLLFFLLPNHFLNLSILLLDELQETIIEYLIPIVSIVAFINILAILDIKL